MNYYKANCPACAWAFEIDAPEVGEIIVCQDCRLNLLFVDILWSDRSLRLELTDAEAEGWAP